jgi:hypothetical protein
LNVLGRFLLELLFTSTASKGMVMNKRRMRQHHLAGQAALWDLASPILQLPRDHLLRAILLDFLLDPELSSPRIFKLARGEGMVYFSRDKANQIACAARALANLRRDAGLETLDHFFADAS